MRKLFCLISIAIISALPASAKLPEKTFDSRNLEEWRRYTAHLVGVLFPERAGMVDVEITYGSMALLEIRQRGDDCPQISVDIEFLDILESEEDYLLPLAHEIAHIELRHRPVKRLSARHFDILDRLSISRLLRGDFRTPEETIMVDFPLMEKQKLAADAFAHRKTKEFGIDPCACQMLRRTGNRIGITLSKPDLFKAIILKRLSVTDERCAKKQ